jgi:hypothetical protein
MLEAEESNPPPLELDRDALEEVGEEALDEVRDDALEVGEVHPMDAFPWDDPERQAP